MRLRAEPALHLILETKGYDPLQDVKKAAAERWCSAGNPDGKHGVWRYAMVMDPSATPSAIAAAVS